MVAVVESAVSVLQLGAFSAIIGVGAAVVWTPFLARGRVRALFATFGWSDNWFVNYWIILTIIGAGEFLLFAAVGLLGDALYSPPGTDTPAENTFFWRGLLVGYGTYMLLLWVIPVVIFPRVGIDWDPHEYDMTTKAIFGAGVLWYQVGGAMAAGFIASIVVI